ncbi:MAG: zinc ribbon domain-containing protein [Candidatus Binatia bacterium]
MVAILGILLALSAAFFVSSPLWQKEVEANRKEQSEKERLFLALGRKKEETYRAIKELDLDYQMGKLSPEDHQVLSRRYKEVALELLNEMDEEQENDREVEEEVEREILSVRRKALTTRRSSSPSAPNVNFCPQCGNQVKKGDNFCTQCGRNLARSEE